MRTLARILYDRKVKKAIRKVLQDKSQPKIQFGRQVLYDSLYGRPGILPTRTTNAIPSWLISNEGIGALRKLGYDSCSRCSGDGWDATCGGSLVICGTCHGIGIVPYVALKG